MTPENERAKFNVFLDDIILWFNLISGLAAIIGLMIWPWSTFLARALLGFYIGGQVGRRLAKDLYLKSKKIKL